MTYWPNSSPDARTSGFLARLRANQVGNIGLMGAAASIPIMMMVGGAVDIGRVYLIKDQLQGACDAAVLMTRKSVVQNNLTTAAKANGSNFFQANFAPNTLGATAPDIALGVDASGAVVGTASAKAPSGILSLFISNAQTISVNCAANMQIGNTDVMFALDTTGSMDLKNPGDSISRLQAMRNAVLEFTTTLTTSSNGTSAVIRYGFVPFSSNVNVGYLLKPEWLVDSWTYQSRKPQDTASTDQDKFVTVKSKPKTSGKASKPKISYTAAKQSSGGGSGDVVKKPTCDKINNPDPDTSRTDWSPNDTAIPRSRTVTKIYNGAYSDVSYDSKKGKCRITTIVYDNYKEIYTETITGTAPKTTYNWIYTPVTYNVAALAGDGNSLTKKSIIVPNLANDQTPVTVTWDGCIEERNTVRDTDFDPIPDAAEDLDIDAIPVDDSTRWRPFLPQLVYWRQNLDNWQVEDWLTTKDARRSDSYENGASASCPSQAMRLAPMARSQVQSYVNSLDAEGYTYLDIGMIWAARLISPTGLFQSQNNASAGSGPTARHIIFMTDGAIEAHDYVYNAYGLEALDRRRTDKNFDPDDSDLNDLIDKRFLAACTAAKAKGITIWTIAFGTSLTDSLKKCSSSNHYFQADNASQLTSTFASIAADIARLRLVK